MGKTWFTGYKGRSIINGVGGNSTSGNGGKSFVKGKGRIAHEKI